MAKTKFDNIDLEFEDVNSGKVIDRLNFSVLIWLQLRDINRAMLIGRKDITIDAVETLETNLTYYISLDKKTKEKLDELNKRFWKGYEKIDENKKKILNQTVLFQYSKEKLKIIMYFLGKKGWLSRT